MVSKLLWPLYEGAVVVETFICTCQNDFVEVLLEQGAFDILALNFLGALLVGCFWPLCFFRRGARELMWACSWREGRSCLLGSEHQLLGMFSGELQGCQLAAHLKTN